MFGMTSRMAVLLAVAALVVSSAGVATAQADDPEWEQEVYDEFEGQVDTFNENVADVELGPAGGRLAGTTANLYVKGSDGAADISFEMDERNRITNLQREPDPDADLKITTTRETVKAIANSKNPAATFRSAYARGDISIEADYDLGGALSGKHGGVMKGVTNWGFWKAAGIFKGFL